MRRLRHASVLATLVLGLLGLGCDPDPAPSTGERPRREFTPEPVAPLPLPASRTVSFATQDGVTIVGDLQPAPTPTAPLVILVHQLASDHNEWAGLRARLHEDPAIATLAIDLRGHGASTAGPAGALDFHTFDNDAWAATQEDVLAAVAYAMGPESGLAPSDLAAVGASIGSTAVIAAAARDLRIHTLVALSPGRAYHGFDSLTPFLVLGDRGFLGIVAHEETENVETTAAMGRVTHTDPIVVDGGAHGVALFEADATTLERTVLFLRERLLRSPTVAPYPPEAPPGASGAPPAAPGEPGGATAPPSELPTAES